MSDSNKLSSNELKELTSLAKEVRKDVVKMITNAKSGHPGGSLSTIEILTTLYLKCMNHYSDWKEHSDWENRDRFILSKGHASPALYSILAESGYFPKEELMSFRSLGSRLQGHPSFGFLQGIEASTGSLGQGLSLSCGIALGLRLDKKDSRVYTLMGDGELQEGQVWEAAMSAAHYNLGNLTAIVDRNNLQIDGCTENIKGLSPLDDKWKSFGWHVIEIDGHDFQQVYSALRDAAKIGKEKSIPVVIIANTVKGKGISFMENNGSWHGKAPSAEECKLALAELGGE